MPRSSSPPTDLEAAIAPALDRLGGAVGLPPDPDRGMLHRYLLLPPFPPSLLEPAAPLLPTAHAIRPACFDQPRRETLPPWVDDLPRLPAVYATLGTAYTRTPGIFPAILKAFATEAVTLIVTVGRNQDPVSFGPQPDPIRIGRHVPQSLLFPRCDLVLSHGGTVAPARPWPSSRTACRWSSSRSRPTSRTTPAAALGVARVIAPNEQTANAFREAARAVLGDAAYRRRAEQIRSEIDALPGLEHAITLLERVAVEQRPIIDRR